MSKVRILSPRPENLNRPLWPVLIFSKKGRKDPPECQRYGNVPFENEVFVGDKPARHAWRIRRRTIRKIIKTEFVNTSFYRFSLLFVEEEPPRPENSKPPHRAVFLLYSNIFAELTFFILTLIIFLGISSSKWLLYIYVQTHNLIYYTSDVQFYKLVHHNLSYQKYY